MRPHHKVIIALVLVFAASLWALSGSSGTDPYRDVHQVLAAEPDPTKPFSVKGTVVAGSIVVEGQSVHFRLADASGDPAREGTSINVTYTGVLPDAFGPKMVVVTGTLVEAAGGPSITATDIQVGCSSKY